VFQAFELNWKAVIETCFKIITVMFAITVVISVAFYYQFHSIPRTDPSYLQMRGYFYATAVPTMMLLFGSLLGVAYFMAISAKHTLDKGIIKLYQAQELEQALDDDAP
jgi:hypothetical protein